MAYTINVGAIRCHILSDGLHQIDGGGFFGLVPRVMWSRTVEPNAQNQVPCDSRALLIESDAGLILVDAGNGDKMNAKQRGFIGLTERNERLISEMAGVGFAPTDVDIAILTHFHNDHIGGFTRFASEGASRTDDTRGVVPTFPKARHFAQRIDLAEASFPNERTRATYHAQNWQPLFDAAILEVVDGPQRLARGVRTDIASGHTRAIQTVWVEDGGESLCFLGDACSWAVHMDRLAWVPAFDLDPMTSIETKRGLRQEAIERDALLVFQHDPQIVTGRLTPGERDWEVTPILSEEPWFDPTE